MIKISELPAASALGGTEVVASVQSSTTVKVLVSAIGTYVRALFTATPATIAEGGTGAATAAAARTALGLGTMAVETATSYLANALLTTIGDSIVASAASTPARLAAVATVTAHATTMNLWAARENVLTGAIVTVTDIADAPYAGAVTWVKMNDAHIWDDGAVFNVQGGADYTAAADDWIRIYATTVSTFEVTVFRANGNAIGATSPGTLTAGTPLQQNPIAATATVTQAHGLGAVPSFLVTTLVCLTNDQGWTAGQVYAFGAGGADNGTNLAAFSVEQNSTNVVIVTSSAVDLNIVNKSTNAVAAITPASWKLVITPYRLN